MPIVNYTPQQQQAIESQAPYICVDAGAGSGKTKVLVDRIVHLLRTEKATLEEIVAITFTEKAALEMKERLRRAFRACAPKDDPQAFSYWRDLERRVDTAHITTIHSFCARLLREHALFLGLDPDFGLLSDAENALLVHDAIDSTMHGLLEQGDGGMLRLATEYNLRTLRGLCRTLLQNRDVVDRIRRRGGMDTAEALSKTWAEAVEEEERRYLENLGNNLTLLAFLEELRSYDGLCDDPEEPRENWRLTMIDAFAAIQAGPPAAEVKAALKRAIDKPPGRPSFKLWSDRALYDHLGKKLLPDAKKFVERVLADEEVPPEFITQSAQLTCDLLALETQVRKAFMAAKENRSRLDFDDLVLSALEVLRKRDTLRAQTAQRINYLMLDEFQDTDGAQLEIAKLLHGEEGGPALFIVGDPKQSIYGFRGAEVEIFRQERDAAEDLVRLDQNFRSLPDVMGFVNHFFSHTKLLGAVETYHPMVVHRERAGGDRVGFILSDPPEGHEGKWPVSDMRGTEAAQIAAEIQQLCAPESRATVCDEHTGAPRRPAYDDVVLLFRGMSSVSLYEEALREAGIPYALVAGAGFYQRQEIIDVINILKVLLDPWDDHALLAWLRGPAVALTDDDIVRLANAGPLGNVVFSDATPEDMNHPERLAHARNLYEALQERRGDALPDLLQFVLEVTGLEAVVLSQYLGLQKASNMRKLVHLAREQAGRSTLSLRQFVQYVEEVHTHEIREGEAGLQPESQGAVTLMTMHKSKGLEFPIVFLPDLARKGGGQKEHTFQIHRHLGIAMRVTGPKGDAIDTPLGRQIKRRIQEDEEAESARLLYVALTRARDRLYLCGTANPTRGSWFHAFDRLHGLCERPHGDTFGADKGGRAFLPDTEGASDIKPATGTETLPSLEGAGVAQRPDQAHQNPPLTPPRRGTESVVSPPATPGEHLPTGDNAWSAIGLRNIPKAISLAETTTTADHAIDREAVARRLAPVLIAEQVTTSISVSRLLSLMTPGHFDGEERPDEDMPRIERDSSYAMDRGTLVHRMFEVWDFAKVGGPDVNRLVRDARMGLMHRDALTDDLVAIQQWFAETPLAQRLGSDDVLRREAPFSLRIGNCIVNGTIDLAMADGTLIDYKTGKMKKTSTARYEKQLLLYAAAMQTLTGTMPKAGLLVYVDAKESVEVSFTPERIAAVLDEARSALA